MLKNSDGRRKDGLRLFIGNFFSVLALDAWKYHIFFGVLFGFLVIGAFAIHGWITSAAPVGPTSAPASTSYTLTDIYNRLVSGSSTSAGNHDFNPLGPPDSSMPTLAQIYSAIPTIDATKVASGTAYLGVEGTLSPAAGSATSGAVLLGETFFGSSGLDWSVQTGSMPNNGHQVITPSVSDQPIALGYHDGSGYVVGDADLDGGNIKFGTNIFGVEGTMVANPLYGDIGDATKVLRSASNPGTYDESNLIPENVRTGINYGAGEVGTFSGELAYGDDDPTRVLTIAATRGTFDVSRLSNDVIGYGTAWGVGLGSRGSMFGDVDSTKVLMTASHAGTFDASHLSSDVIANGITWGDRSGSVGMMFGDTSSSKVLTTAHYPGTYDSSQLNAGTVQRGVTFGQGLVGDYPSALFPLTGNTATADLTGNGSKITSPNGSFEWWKSDGTKQNAVLDFPALASVCSDSTVNTSAGTLSVSAETVAVGSSYCGVTGTLLAGLYNGTRTTNSATWPGGAQGSGGVEDFNSNGSSVGQSPPADRYARSWVQCTAVNNYCGTGDTGAAYKDGSTGLIWSKTMNSATFALDDSNGTMNWFLANNCNESSGSACSKKSSLKTGCDANSGWSLPHQKQFMQAYIDGSYGILEPVGVSAGSVRSYWSATTLSSNLPNAWTPNLSSGNTSGSSKTGSAFVRCVR